MLSEQHGHGLHADVEVGGGDAVAMVLLEVIEDGRVVVVEGVEVLAVVCAVSTAAGVVGEDAGEHSWFVAGLGGLGGDDQGVDLVADFEG